jgi:predicted dinucleotide-binding enzyme
MKIAFIGIGKVGFALAVNLEKKGHQIIIGSDSHTSLSAQNALAARPSFLLKSIQEAVDSCDLVLLAIPFQAVDNAVKGVRFSGKTLIDCTNPVGAGITHGLNNKISGSEYIQKLVPDARVVKAFTIYGYENLADPVFPGYEVRPVMLYAGDDAASKRQAAVLIEDAGFMPKDTGPLEQALHLEHMTLLWVKMARLYGHHPRFVWAYLEKQNGG